tara:strand:+ start:420 stop:872 length:453 start_codon:yes stop_codon:yes gene_type:complete
LFNGCTEEPVVGCTDCNAVNFNNNANEEDGSCILINNHRIGQYAVRDSTMDWVFDWWHDEYSISIERDSCNSVGIIIDNYANMSNSVNSFRVRADINGDSILIPYQQVFDFEILQTDGYFRKDSIYFQIYYLTPNFGDPYIGNVYGKKFD